MKVRWVLGLVGWMGLCCAGVARAEVQLELGLKDGKTAFRSGEPIVLEMTFRSSAGGMVVNTTTTEPVSPVDDVVLTPLNGVTPWMELRARGQRYTPDYMALAKVEEGVPAKVSVTLNDLYRIDEPGQFTVHVVSRRAGKTGRDGTQEGTVALTSNDVSFDVAAFPEGEEAALAASLEAGIRSSGTQPAAEALARQLAYLPGDAATRVKLSLYLHPKEFYPFAVDVSQGLWIARNRGMVVEGLETALADPRQVVSAPLLDLLVALRLSLEQPFQPGMAGAGRDAAEAMRLGYVHQLAGSLGERRGEARLEAAQTVLLGGRKRAASADFEAAREVLITHFGEVNEYTVEWLLQGFGREFEDPRMVPALERLLDTTPDATFANNRVGALRLLAVLAPGEVPRYLAREACAEHPARIREVKNLSPAETLPGVAECLLAKMRRDMTAEGRRYDLGVTMGYVARFADASLVEPVRAAYLARMSDWDQSAQAAAVVYLMRWDAKRSGALLAPMLPGKDQSGGAMMFFLEEPAHLPADGLRAAFREGVRSEPPGIAKAYPSALAAIGAPEDRVFLREELERLRIAEGTAPVEGSGELEGELVAAVVQGASWQASKEEADALAGGCVSEACRRRFALR